MYRSTFAIACALVVAAVQCAEVSNQLRHYLDKNLVATAKAGYTPSAFVIPGSELEVPDQSKFQAGGFFSVSTGFETNCADSQAVSVAANTCIVDGVFSYKLQLAKDSCAGASIQYFYDDVCSLYVGSSMLDASVEKCLQGPSDSRGRPMYTSLTCSAKAHREYKMVQDIDIQAAGDPTAEPTAMPTFMPTQQNTAFPTSAGASLQTFTADQEIEGISISEWNSNLAANELSVKTAVAGSMDGVTINDISNFRASGENRRLEAVTLRRLQGSNSVIVVYTVSVTSQLTASQLFNQLSNNIAMGTFNILLHQAAQANSATDLLDAESNNVSYYDDGNNGNRLSGGAIAGIIVGVIFGVILLALVIYLFAAGAGGSGDGVARKPVESGPPTEL